MRDAEPGTNPPTPTRTARIALYATAVAVAAVLIAGMFVCPFALGYFGPEADRPTAAMATRSTTLNGPSTETTSPLEYHTYAPYEEQYALLAESFAHGRLDLDLAPYPYLDRVGNPYDSTQRTVLVQQYGVSALPYWDTAYYHGRFYVYFGVLPAVLFYLPWYLLTGCGFPTPAGIAVLLLVVCLGVANLLIQLARRFFPNVSLGALMLAVALTPLASMLAWCAMNATIYAMPVACGLACLTWGAALYARLDRHPWAVVPGSLLLALTFACRPQLGVFCVLLIPFGVAALSRRHAFAGYLAAALAPFVVVAVLLGWYNAARFGSPLDFGASYNLTTNDMRLRPWMAEGALAGLYYYFAQAPNVIPTFPLLTDTAESFDYPTYLVSEPCYGGVLWLAPVLWFLCALLPAPRGAAKPLPGGTWLWRLVVGVAVGLALLLAALDALAAGILPRYVTDFMLPLSVLAALGFLRTSTRTGSPVDPVGKGTDLVPFLGDDQDDAVRDAEPVAIRPWVARCATACLIVALIVSVAIFFYPWSSQRSSRRVATLETTAYVSTQLF